MTQGKLVRAIGYYNDASYIERIVATFRKLLIDIDWIYGRKINDNGLYEVYLYVRDHPNFKHAVLNLSKTVGIERVEVYDNYDIKIVEVGNDRVEDVEAKERAKNDNKTVFIVYIPTYSQATAYSWGEEYGENIS